MERALLEEAVREIRETGRLDLSTRQKLWLSYGPMEWEEETAEQPPCTLTTGLRTRLALAEACARKVLPIWSAAFPEDKLPQETLSLTQRYLEGNASPEALKQAFSVSGDLINDLGNEGRDSVSVTAGLVALHTALLALVDEPLLYTNYLGAQDRELDIYDWDSAYLACLAFSWAQPEWDKNQRTVKELEFWVWYLEQAAELGGLPGFQFPDAEKVKQEVQERLPASPPLLEETTLESFVEFVTGGTYVTHYIHADGTVTLFTTGIVEETVCPICGTTTSNLDFVSATQMELPPVLDHTLRLLQHSSMFRCGGERHPNLEKRFLASRYSNDCIANYYRYFQDCTRIAVLASLLERPAKHMLNLAGAWLQLDDITLYHIEHPNPVGSNFSCWPSVHWDRQNYQIEFDLTKLDAEVCFWSMPYREFLKKKPVNYPYTWMEQGNNATIRFSSGNVTQQFTLAFDSPAQEHLLKVTAVRLWSVNLTDAGPNKVQLIQAIQRILGLSLQEAKAWVEGLPNLNRNSKGVSVRKGLVQTEAEQLLSDLRAVGAEGRLV